MLEGHVVPFIREWRVGLGMMGKQGAESTHAYFNALERMYSKMTNSVERLKCMVLEHLRQTCPLNIARQLPPQKQLKISAEECTCSFPPIYLYMYALWQFFYSICIYFQARPLQHTCNSIALSDAVGVTRPCNITHLPLPRASVKKKKFRGPIFHVFIY